MNSLKDELIERYEQTGRIGFHKPKTKEEAYELIETILDCYNTPEPETITINLSDLTKSMNNFLNNF